MNFYEKICKKNVKVPDSFDLLLEQLVSLEHDAPNYLAAVYAGFKFGYMQGVRAERAGKAVL